MLARNPPAGYRRSPLRRAIRQSQKFRLQSSWHVEGRIEELAALLLDTNALPTWWSTAFFEARVVDPGGECAAGRVFDLCTRGWLPYTLRFRMRVRHVDYPTKFVLASEGDFAGLAVGRLIQRKAHACVAFDWRVRVRKPWLTTVSPLLRPLMRANHFWVMKQGQLALDAEIRRRRGCGHADAEAVEQGRQLTAVLGFRAAWPSQLAAAASSRLLPPAEVR